MALFMLGFFWFLEVMTGRAQRLGGWHKKCVKSGGGTGISENAS
jgi:hypothetical protein